MKSARSLSTPGKCSCWRRAMHSCSRSRHWATRPIRFWTATKTFTSAMYLNASTITTRRVEVNWQPRRITSISSSPLLHPNSAIRPDCWRIDQSKTWRTVKACSNVSPNHHQQSVWSMRNCTTWKCTKIIHPQIQQRGQPTLICTTLRSQRPGVSPNPVLVCGLTKLPKVPSHRSLRSST